MGIKEREWKDSSFAYRFGFQGQEGDDEVSGEGNSYDYGARIYDSRLGRFYAMDAYASKAPSWSTYRYGFDNPIFYGDNDGNYENPKNGWQRFWNRTSGMGNYNDFADFKAEIEKSGVGRIENVDYSNKNDIQYNLIRKMSYLETNTDEQTKDYVKEVTVIAAKKNRLSFGTTSLIDDITGERLTNATFEELIMYEVDQSLNIGEKNPITGHLKGGGQIEPVYIEYDIIEFVASGGSMTIIRKSSTLGVKNLAKREARKKARETISMGSKRAAMREAKRDAGIPTSQTHRTHKKHNSADKSGGKGVDYEFDGGKTIQNHPDGHTPGHEKPHWNNHPDTKKHYDYEN